MTLEITGQLVRIPDVQTGMGKNGEWKKQEFVLELPGQYPRQVCISLWGDKIEALKNFNIGDQMKAYIDLESREFSGKWYTNVKAWQLEKVEGGTTFSAPANSFPDIPPPVSSADIPPEAGEMDDLPF